MSRFDRVSARSVAAYLKRRGIPPDQIRDAALGHLADLVAAGVVVDRDGVLVEMSTGNPLDPFAPLPRAPGTVGQSGF